MHTSVANVTKNKFFSLDTNSLALRNLGKYILNFRDINSYEEIFKIFSIITLQ